MSKVTKYVIFEAIRHDCHTADEIADELHVARSDAALLDLLQEMSSGRLPDLITRDWDDDGELSYYDPRDLR
jgi:hypothetical protein